MFANYLEDFSSLMKNTEATDSGSNRLDLDQALEKTILRLERLVKEKKKAIFIGNGGSAGIASHQSVDFWKNGSIRSVAFNDSSLLTCISNDYSFAEVFSKPTEMFADPGDLMMAFSSSGKSANILNAVNAAIAKGCDVITFSGFRNDNPLRAKGMLNYFLPSLEYGLVEVGHLYLSHTILDHYMFAQGTLKHPSFSLGKQTMSEKKLEIKETPISL
jgi:D-sedoheptulose 7-phosphate isomerase